MKAGRTTKGARRRANHSLTGLRWGALLGVVNGLLVLSLVFLAEPRTMALSFSLIVLNSGLFVGVLVGGLCGLHTEWRGLPTRSLYGKLLWAQGLFVALLAVAACMQWTS